MKNKFSIISLRQNAIFIPNSAKQQEAKGVSDYTFVFVSNLLKLGYSISEDLLSALKQTTPAFQDGLLHDIRQILGTNKNWTPLVKGWDTPTDETISDHFFTFFTNVFGLSGTKMQCGHIIPNHTFPLERYNGCPFCGTPFEFGKIEKYGQGSNKKILELWTETELNGLFKDLLMSKTALDATQVDTLKTLLLHLPLPKVKIEMKETMILVIDILVEGGQEENAQALFGNPTDILRYLWFKHTGNLQIIEPKTIVKRKINNRRSDYDYWSSKTVQNEDHKAALKLKYTRKKCAMVAKWLNNLEISAESACEIMHPKRAMWIRFIRALRLAEYSKRNGFSKLNQILDVFYKETYPVWQGNVEKSRVHYNQEKTFSALQERPSSFARALFANMLWFGAEPTVAAFGKVVDKVPTRLVFTLDMYKNYYFEQNGYRTVKPLGGVAKSIPTNQMLYNYTTDYLEEMKDKISGLCDLAISKRFEGIKTTNKSIYIEESLFKIPISIGDRSETVQDSPVALMGTRFPIEGDKVRLFMQWGVGLSAQHLDMDLSCEVNFHNSSKEYCSYSDLETIGCKHSGDIRHIPNKVGTAEYIELDLRKLEAAKAKTVIFTCNAYSDGELSPNLVVGWMNSKHKMHISERTGVAYDPSCVQHQIRIVQNLSKGLVFGILEVQKREIVWVEMPFDGQIVQNLNTNGVEGLLKKLNCKLSVGNLLLTKAAAQRLTLVDDATEADEVYTAQWATNTAAVTQVLLG
jgi:hypothetical protein